MSTLSTWFTKANAFANIRNGRSYAQVTAQKTLLPVSAACIRKTPDRNANAMKKVHNFPQRPKVSALRNGFSAQVRSNTPCVTVTACAGKKQTHANQKLFTKHQPKAQALTLTNRFKALSAEEPNLPHVNDNIFDIESPQNYLRAPQLAQRHNGNNISLNKHISSTNVPATPTAFVVSKPAKPQIAQKNFTKGDSISVMTNLTHNTSADHMPHGQLDSHMALPQTRNVPEEVWQNRLYSKIIGHVSIRMVITLAIFH